jgi:Na+/H+-dicarboxylate symporter/ABC-type amino acid transport substrate-binding protein
MTKTAAMHVAGRRRLGLAEQVLIGLVLGIAAGIFFGEMTASLKIAGDAFIMLLQITVIPYIMVSLIIALGRLTLDDAKSIALKAGGVLLVLWGVGLAVVLLTPLAFPDWPSASFFSTAQVEEAKPVDFLQLYIPANPFNSLSNAVVPAIVVFSVLLGLALIGVRSKNALLEPLSAVADALMGVTGMIGRLAPYGIFALTAGAAGTIDIAELSRLQVYVVTYVAIALILSFWLLPALIAAATPLRYGDIIRALRGPLITAFATGNVLIILPLLAECSKGLLAESEKRASGVEQQTAESSVDILIPAAFNFPSLGLVLTLMFVLFGGWYVGASVPVLQYPLLSAAGLASLFGGTVLAIPFLLDLLQLPNDLFQVFVTVDVLGSRFGTLLAGMHIVTIALIGTFALQGRTRFGAWSMVRLVGVTVVLFAVALGGIRAFYTYVVVAPYTKDQALKGMHLLANPQPAKVYSTWPVNPPAAEGKPPSLAEIKEHGVLRACYMPDDYPSAFLNSAQPPQLVGFDVEVAHRFARSIELPIEFLPIGGVDDAIERLDSGACDILTMLLPISAATAESFAMTVPIIQSSVGLIVRDHQRNAVRTWDDVRKRGVAFRLAVRGSTEALAMARSLLPQATFVPVFSKREQGEILESGAAGVDAIASLSEEGAAWTVLYPRFSLVVPKPAVFLPVGYAVAAGNDKLLTAFNAWLLAEKSRGAIDELYRYWMLGKATQTERSPRWSVIRDVLHWVDGPARPRAAS